MVQSNKLAARSLSQSHLADGRRRHTRYRRYARLAPARRLSRQALPDLQAVLKDPRRVARRLQGCRCGRCGRVGRPREKAEADVAEQAWRFPVGYGLTIEQMRSLGLYISDPRSSQETDRPFSEPGLFLVNPASNAQIIDVSNAPFARPDLQMILNGVKTIIEKSYPVRGTHA